MRRFTPADGMLLACVSIWGFNITAVKLLLDIFPPLALSVLRFGLATAVFAVLVPAVDSSPPVSRRSLPLLVVAGLCGIWLNQVAFTYGLQNTSATSLSLLLASMPIFAGIAVWLLGSERTGGRHWTGVAIGFAGVALVVLGSRQAAGHGEGILGDLLALLTAASWAAYSLLLRPLMAAWSALRISLWVTAVGLLALLPLGIPQLTQARWSHFVPSDAALLAFSAVGAIVVTNMLWYHGVHRVGAARATVYSYVQPFVGVLFAVLVLNERVTALQMAGGLVIIAGLIFGRESRP